MHIISFDVPCPADYGGVIDVFYKLRALHNLGLNITLHCFDYGRGRPKKLKEICQEVHYYDRSLSIVNQFSIVPFIVKSRINEQLVLNLIKDGAPILFEGLHTCGIINDSRLNNRKKLVRMHNVEHLYYEGLAKAETNILRKLYFRLESYKLSKYESMISMADQILAISESDTKYFQRYNKITTYLPAFVEAYSENKNAEIHNFCLYHGNLEVVENQNALSFLVSVFDKLSIQLVVAGKNPPSRLKKLINSRSNIELIENPNNEELNELVSKARLNCLPTFQSTGIKLKLIKALATGNLVLVNNQMVEGTELSKFCLVANSEEDWITNIKKVFNQNVDLHLVSKRRESVRQMFDNDQNAKALMELLV